MLMGWQVSDVGGGIPAAEAVQMDAEAIVSALSPESMDIPIVSRASPTLDPFTAECLGYRKTGKHGQKRRTRLLPQTRVTRVTLCYVGCQVCLLVQLARCQIAVRLVLLRALC